MRTRLRAETIEAIRVGAIGHGERTSLPTAPQRESLRLAGLRAVALAVAGIRGDAVAN